MEIAAIGSPRLFSRPTNWDLRGATASREQDLISNTAKAARSTRFESVIEFREVWEGSVRDSSKKSRWVGPSWNVKAETQRKTLRWTVYFASNQSISRKVYFCFHIPNGCTWLIILSKLKQNISSVTEGHVGTCTKFLTCWGMPFFLIYTKLQNLAEKEQFAM